MSSFKWPKGDDFPAAAERHLDDSATLLASSPHGACYLAGYVVECSTKTVLQHANLTFPQIKNFSHNLNALQIHIGLLAAAGNPQIAPYVPRYLPGLQITQSSPNGWSEIMRYEEAGKRTASDAEAWHKEAYEVFYDTVVKLIVDGIIT